jgi:hypothetical protein
MVGLAAVLAALGVSVAVAQSGSGSESIDGRWDASLDNHGTQIPFRLDISGSGPTLKGTFYDGFKPYDGTTSATYQDGKLTLSIEHYLTTITASVNNGALTGMWSPSHEAATLIMAFRQRGTWKRARPQ